MCWREGEGIRPQLGLGLPGQWDLSACVGSCPGTPFQSSGHGGADTGGPPEDAYFLEPL